MKGCFFAASSFKTKIKRYLGFEDDCLKCEKIHEQHMVDQLQNAQPMSGEQFVSKIHKSLEFANNLSEEQHQSILDCVDMGISFEECVMRNVSGVVACDEHGNCKSDYM